MPTVEISRRPREVSDLEPMRPVRAGTALDLRELRPQELLDAPRAAQLQAHQLVAPRRRGSRAARSRFGSARATRPSPSRGAGGRRRRDPRRVLHGGKIRDGGAIVVGDGVELAGDRRDGGHAGGHRTARGPSPRGGGRRQAPRRRPGARSRCSCWPTQCELSTAPPWSIKSSVSPARNFTSWSGPSQCASWPRSSGCPTWPWPRPAASSTSRHLGGATGPRWRSGTNRSAHRCPKRDPRRRRRSPSGGSRPRPRRSRASRRQSRRRSSSPPKLTHPHPAVTAIDQALGEATPDPTTGQLVLRGYSESALRVSPGLKSRALRILDALLKALVARRHAGRLPAATRSWGAVQDPGHRDRREPGAEPSRRP